MPINQYDDIVANLSPKPEPSASVNPYDDILRQEDAAFGISIQQGTEKTPEVSAQVLDIQRKTGLPAAFVERNLDTIKQKAIKKEAEDYRRLNPVTGAWLAESPYHFSLAQDDLKNLGAMERLTNIFKPVPALAFANVTEAASGAVGLLGYDEQARRFRADVEAVRRQVNFEHPLERGSWSEATRNAFISIYSQVPSYAIGLLTGGATIPLTIMGTQAGLQKTSELEAGGVSKPMAAVGGTVSGLAEALTEMIPFGAAMDILKASKPVGKSLIKGFISDQLGEQVATGVDTAIDKVSIRPDMGWEEYLQRVVDTAKTTTVQAGVMGGAAAGVNRLTRSAEQKQPQTVKDVLLEVGKVAEASMLRQKSPETFQEVTKKLVEGGIENVYVPVEAWETYWQEQGAEPSTMAQELGVTPDAYNEAVANNRPLTIATDAYVRKIAPTEHNAFFADEVKTREDAMNARELQDFLKAMETSPVDKVKEISDYVASQLEATGKYTKEQAQIQAEALWGAPFKTLAERVGLDPLELFKQYNLSITKGNVPRGTSGQTPLADFIRKQGGISAADEFMKGEVRDRFSVKAGYNLINNKTGQTLDRLAESAWEAGYFQSRPTVSEFLDALRSDVDAKTNKTGTAVMTAEGRDIEAELDAEWAKHMGMGEEYWQKKDKTPRARITFGPEGVNIDILKNANASSFIHETGHFYLKMLGDLATMEGANEGIRSDYQDILNWLGAKEGETITTAQHEQWARGFEAYLRDGKAPSVALRSAFAKFKEWLKQVYRSLRSLNVELTPEVTNVMDRLFASEEEIDAARSEVNDSIVDFVSEGKNLEDITMDDLNNVIINESTKSIIRKMTGLRDTYAYIREDKALAASWKKAEQSARVAFRAGKAEEAGVWKEKLSKVIVEAKEKVAKIETEKQKMTKRRKQINAIIEYMGLEQGQAAKLMRHRDLALMTDFEYKKFKDDLLVKAGEMQETAFAKARIMHAIAELRLKNVENYRKAMEYPPITKMTADEAHEFADLLEGFHEGDVFLTERELETVDRTDLAGIRTWREARERLAKETGSTIEELEAIKVGEFDEYRWDTALADQNPFYKMLVEETTRKLLTAEMRSHDVQNEVYDLARKSAKSQGWSLVKTLIPQDKLIMAYMEAPADVKESIASDMTPEQLDLAHYMEEYFGRALEYLIKTKSLTRGRENYFVHMRRSFLENLKEDGLLNAVKSVFKNYQDEEMVFNILDEDTGNILPMEKFFQYSMRRTGALEPTQNVIKAFLAYAKTFEKKVALDELIPKMDIYAQSLTPTQMTPRGLEIDRSIKKFVNKYINNKKGRHIRWISKQGGKVDLSIRAMRTFTTLLDLGLNIPVGLASFIGETGGNFVMLGAKDLAKGVARGHTVEGKKILEKYEAFTGRSAWEEFTVPGKEVSERLIEGLFGLFHQSAQIANKHYLLASLTKKEFESGEISEERLAQIKIEMGRLRVVPGSRSLVGSTSAGGAAVQYKSWAVPIVRTLSKDVTTLLKDLKNRPTGEALTTREAREIYRVIGLSFTVLVVLGAGDDDDKSFTGRLSYKIRTEALSFMQGMDPKLWLSVPRILTFMAQLGNNLHSLATLEEYKTKTGLKGVGGLEKQFTPAAVRGITSEDNSRR